MTALITKLNEANDLLNQLSPYPPPPKITNISEVDTYWIDSQLAPLRVVRLPLDGKYRLTNKSNFIDIVAWDWVDSKPYERDIYDCENFAISFKARVDWYFALNQVGIVIDYTSGHGYNLVIFPNGDVMLLEPQSDGLVYWEDRVAILYALTGAFVLL